jgi:hypothetical protein
MRSNCKLFILCSSLMINDFMSFSHSMSSNTKLQHKLFNTKDISQGKYFINQRIFPFIMFCYELIGW